MEELIYPVRINKYLAFKNICTRRKADDLVVQKKVLINGQVAKLGDKVNANDEVKVLQKENSQEPLVYLAYNKPKGIITHSPQENEVDIKGVLKFSKEVFPIGRLDKNSQGLIILTNDGRITDKLLNPKYYHEKEYVVSVDKKIVPRFLSLITAGVQLDGGYVTKPCKIKKINQFTFSITLTEGKKHQIRRMCSALGYNIVDLIRTRIINIQLQDLEAGRYRKIRGEDLKEFLSVLEIENL
jgi:23S rRNA pseudouridine2604 synthase